MLCSVIKSGSKGNAVAIRNGILIDCGVPFKSLRDVYQRLRIVLLTHKHSDHFNKATVLRLAKERPTLRFAAPPWMVSLLVNCEVSSRVIDVITLDTWHNYGPFKIQAFPLIHNVDNCGYKVHFSDGRKLIYATDTNSLEHVVAKDYNLYLIEANYTEEDILARIKAKEAAGEHVYEYDVLKNHLSAEKANNWLYENMGPNSSYIYMHEHQKEMANGEL